MKYIFTLIIVVTTILLQPLTAQNDFCPGNYFDNGDFEIGTPTASDQDIDNAQGWMAIWGSGSIADFYTSTAGPFLYPSPADGNYGGFWVSNINEASTIYREGLYNKMLIPVISNSGDYSFTFDLACLGGWGTAEIGVYGVYNPSALPSITPTASHVPTNINLFGAANTALLGNFTVPGMCDGAKQNLNVTFSSSTGSGFPTNGITHILITRSPSITPVVNGRRYVGVDNFCLTVAESTDQGAYCCEGDNLVENGNFENSANGFTSDYTEDPSVYPGAYNVSDDASIFGASITDHSACVNPDQYSANTDFLLVNGRTTQPAGTTSVIWQQSITIDPEKNYKFCANFKNMPQCTFDIKPEIRLEVNGQLTDWITIDTNSDDPCDWQQISECFDGNQDILDIKIHLKEDGLGDGNDLAIDDISLQAKLDQNLNLSVLHQGNPQQLTGSINSIDTTDDTLLVGDICTEQNNGYQYNWFVYELASYPLTQPIDFINMAPDSFAWSSNIGGFNNQLPTSANPVWGLTTTFPNYTFEHNKLYVIGMYVPSCCDSCYDDAWSYQITFSSESDTPPAMNVFTTEVKDHIRSLFVLGEGNNGTLGRNDTEVIDFTMYPNPTSDVLRFKSDETIVSYKITDITGKLVQSKAIEVSEIDVSQLSANMYFVTVTTASGINHTEKFIKK